MHVLELVAEDLKSGVFLGFVVYRKNRLAPCDVIATPHCVVRNGWGPVVPGVCTVHRLVLTPTATTLEPHAALCPTIKFLCYKGLDWLMYLAPVLWLTVAARAIWLTGPHRGARRRPRHRRPATDRLGCAEDQVPRPSIGLVFVAYLGDRMPRRPLSALFAATAPRRRARTSGEHARRPPRGTLRSATLECAPAVGMAVGRVRGGELALAIRRALGAWLDYVRSPARVAGKLKKMHI